jgi:hypothetical protein
MQTRLLFHRISQAAVLARAAFLKTAVHSTVPTAAYLQRLLFSPLFFVLKAIGPSMAPTINNGVAERAVGQVGAHVFLSLHSLSNPYLPVIRRSFFGPSLFSMKFGWATLLPSLPHHFLQMLVPYLQLPQLILARKSRALLASFASLPLLATSSWPAMTGR